MKKPIRILLLFILIITVLSINAVGQPRKSKAPPPADVTTTEKRVLDLGQLNGTEYTNAFFGLSLTIPEKWLVMEAERRAALDSEVKKMVQTPDQQRQTKIEESIERTKTLIRVTKLPVGQPQNAQLMLVAERLPSPGIKTGLEVIEIMKQTMKGTNFNIEFLEVPHNESIGGAEFGVVTVKVESPYGPFIQKIYMLVRNEYALELFYTYTDDADLPAFDGVMKSVKIK